MYDTLLQLPLFQGLAHEDFTSILEKVKLHFTRHKAGSTLVKKGSICNQLIFILSGEVAASSSSINQSYTIIEFMQGPHLIEPYSLFGMNTSYAKKYTVQSETHTVSISKDLVLNELFKYEIFRLNYMNIISNRAQNLHTRLWTETAEDLESRIKQFILLHTELPTGKKIIKIKMEELANAINESRLSVSKALNNMQGKGILELRRGEIEIPELKSITL